MRPPKVPRPTAYFWIIKILTTAMGETTSDYLVHRFNPYLAVAMGGVGLVAALAWQFSVPDYVPWVYWLAAVMVSITGTMGADVVHVEFKVPYFASALAYAVVLAVIFAAWYRTEGTLSIHSITTVRRELFYWAAVLATFALGTATGDLTAYTWHLGFFTSGAVFAVLFAIPAIGFWRFRLNAILAFWWAYILTRPLGASFSDGAGKPVSGGGLGWGDPLVTLVLSLFIVALVAYLSVTGVDRQPATSAA